MLAIAMSVARTPNTMVRSLERICALSVDVTFMLASILVFLWTALFRMRDEDDRRARKHGRDKMGRSSDLLELTEASHGAFWQRL